MKNYEIKVNLNEGKRFFSAELDTVATVSAQSKNEAESKFKEALMGADNGVKMLVDWNRYSGMKIRAFVA